MQKPEYTRLIKADKATAPQRAGQAAAPALADDASTLTRYTPQGEGAPRPQADEDTRFSADGAAADSQSTPSAESDHTVFVGPGGMTLSARTDLREPLPHGTMLHGESYAIERVIGRGGFGVTYLATDVNLDLQVVIKENMPQGAGREPGSLRVIPQEGEEARKVYTHSLDNFYKEARIIAKIGARENNPHIVRVKACFKELNTAYYVMDYVAGESLSSVYADGISQAELLDLLLALLDGLEYLHRHRICHLDIKPANILMVRDKRKPVLIDFGAACHLESSDRRYERVYSDGYSPPEQVAGETVNETADIYALGATAYRLMTGTKCTAAASRLSQMHGVAQAYSPALLRSIEKALAQNPQERWQSAHDWVQDLRMIKQEPASPVKPVKPASPEPPKPQPAAPQPEKPELQRLLDEAKRGVSAAKYELGKAFEHGNYGVSPESAVALKWYQKAAERGHSEAGKAWFRLAKKLAGSGNPVAQREVAHALRYGKYGADKDLHAARSWYQKAVEQGDAQARKALEELKKSDSIFFGGAVLVLCFIWAVVVCVAFALEDKPAETSALSGDAAPETGAPDASAVADSAEALYQKGEQAYSAGDFVQAVAWFRKAAEQGNADAQHMLGNCYYYEQGVVRDYGKAMIWFRKAAGQGNADAPHMVGNCYYYEQGVVRDYGQAMIWFCKAAAQGNADAQRMVGNCYYLGQGVAQDYGKAVTWFRKAAEQGNADAQRMLGNCYYHGQGVVRDYGQMVAWFRKAAEQGNADAQRMLGYCYYLEKGVAKDYGQAVAWFRKAAEQGNADAQHKLGHCCYHGQGVLRDYGQAVAWFRKAAGQGNADAQHMLGYCHYQGYGVAKDYGQAVAWFCKAAEQGNARAQYMLGYCYYLGQGVAQDYGKAVTWLREAAEQGIALAQYDLGKCYEMGHGVPVDLQMACEWYQKSADQGVGLAYEALSRVRGKLLPGGSGL